MNENDNEVQQLIEELDRLQIQITRVNERLKQIDRTTDNQTNRNHTATNNTLNVGDIVEVTNRYKDRLGVQGTIIKIKSAQVVIRETEGDQIFRKYKGNVKRVR